MGDQGINEQEPMGEGIPASGAILLIGNLFLIVGIVLVDSTAIRIVLLVIAALMLGVGVAILSRHATRLKALHGPLGDGRDAPPDPPR